MALSTLKHRSAVALVGIVAAFTAGSAVTITGASAAPTDGATPTHSQKADLATKPNGSKTAPTVKSVTEQLTALSNRNEMLTEDYNLASEDVKVKQAQARAAARTATRSVATYEGARNEMKLSLQAQYQEGSFRETTALLTSTSGQNYLDKSTALQQISSRRAGLATQMNDARTASVKASATAAALLVAATTKRDALARQRISLAAQQTKYKDLLDQLNAKQQRAFLQTPSEGVTKKQLAAVAAEQNSGDTAAAKASKNDSTAKASKNGSSAKASKTGNTTKTSKNGSTAKARKHGDSGAGASAPSSAAAKAVKYALAQLGKPYVYATSGPKTFDCSGLTAAAWRAAGRNIPHQSRLQSHLGHRVSRSDLKPGDLVFYYSPIHHVAIYIGKGLVVSAPQTGDVVKIVAVGHGGSYNMAVRL